jgi:hypothetical protein
MKHGIMMVILILMISCKGADSPEALAEKMRGLGVYAETESGISPVSAYGVESQDVMSETTSFTFTGTIPDVQRISHFYLNLPDASVSESKLYLLDDVREARWHYFVENDPRDPKPVSATVEPVSGNIYKFSSAELLAKDAGFACLWASMPMGSPARMYCVHLKGA